MVAPQMDRNNRYREKTPISKISANFEDQNQTSYVTH